MTKAGTTVPLGGLLMSRLVSVSLTAVGPIEERRVM